MVKGSDKTHNKNFLQKLWRWTRRILIWLFIAQLIYIVILKWINPNYDNAAQQLDKRAWIETGLCKQKFYFTQYETGSNFFRRPAVSRPPGL